MGNVTNRWSVVATIFWGSAAALVAAPAAGQLPLGGPILVNSATTAGDQQGPSVGIADDGRIRVFWNDVTASDVTQRGFAADGTPFAASAPNESDFSEQDAHGAVNGSGDWIVTWNTEQESGDGRDLFARRSSSNGSILAAEFQVNATAAADITASARAARADDDSYVVTWVDVTQPGDLLVRKFAANGTAVTGELFANQATDPDLAQFGVAAGPDGSFLVTWQEDAPTIEQVYARCFDANGVALGSQFVVPAEQPTRNLSPRAAVDGLGNYVVAWIEGGSADLEWRRLSPNCTPLGGDHLAAAGGVSGTQGMTFDVARDGAMLFAWNSTDLDPDQGISVLELTKSGAVVGGEFLAHASATGAQVGAGAAIGDRLFAVVWASPDGSGNGNDDVFLRRYVRRVVFTDDFENDGTDYWSAVAP
jgi:hypothetical protein